MNNYFDDDNENNNDKNENDFSESENEFCNYNSKKKEDDTIIDELIKSLLNKIENDKANKVDNSNLRTENNAEINKSQENNIDDNTNEKNIRNTYIVNEEDIIKAYQILMDCNNSDYIIYFRM